MFYGNSYGKGQYHPEHWGESSSPLSDWLDGAQSEDTVPASSEVEEQVAAEEEIKTAIEGYLKSISPDAVMSLYEGLAALVSSPKVSEEEKADAHLLYLNLRTVQAFRKELSLSRVLGEPDKPYSDVEVSTSEEEALALGKKMGIGPEVDQVLNDFASAEEVISMVPLYAIGDDSEKEIDSPSPGQDLRAINQSQVVLSIRNGILDAYQPKQDIPPWVYFAVGGAVLFGVLSFSKKGM